MIRVRYHDWIDRFFTTLSQRSDVFVIDASSSLDFYRLSRFG